MIEFIKTIINPQLLLETLINALAGWWMYVALFAIVFAETGLLIGFFLPGDTFLFILGVIAGAGDLNVIWLILLLSLAAILGDSFGYYLGKEFGMVMSMKSDTWYFKQSYVKKTQAFFEKYGSRTILYARFIPVVRTFAPFVAGMGNMHYYKFLMYNVVGGIFWVTSMILLGYFLGNLEFIQHNLEKIILLILALSLLPSVIEILTRKLRRLYNK